MQKRLVGHTNLWVSVIGLGTVKFGRNQCVNYPASFVLPSDKDIIELLALAADLGINLLDTAPAYGLSEERLGKLLDKQRQTWIISTKVGEEFTDGVSQFDFSAAAITNSIERSLQRLRTDYVDIVLVHSNGEDVRIIEEEQVFATLAQLKAAGKIRAYGMSTKTLQGGLLTVEQADLAMVTYHPDAREDQPIIASAHQKKKGIFIKKALASGHLPRSPAENMQFIFAESGVTSVIIGTVNPTHLRENVRDYLA